MERDEGREDGWRGGRWAVRLGSDGEAGYPPPPRRVQRAVEGALAAAFHRANLVRILPSAFGWDVLALGGVAADAATVLRAVPRRARGFGLAGLPEEQAGAGTCFAALSLPDPTPRSLLKVYIYTHLCIFVGAGGA